MTEQFPPFGYPGSQPAVAAPKARRRRRTALIAGSGAVILAIAGVAAFLAWPGSGGSTVPGGSAVPHGPATLAATFDLPGTDKILYALFSPDGKLLAIAGTNDNDQNVYIWDAATHRYRATLTAPGGASQIGFSADDNQVTVVEQGGAVVRWNLATGTRSVITPIRSTSPEALSGDGNILATRDSAGHGIDVWDLRTGRLITDLPNPVTGAPDITSMDNPGQTLAVGGPSRTYVWDIPSRRVIATLRYPPGKSAQAVYPVLTADGKDIEFQLLSNLMPTLANVATQSNVTPLDARWPRQYGIAYLSTAGAICATQGSSDEHIDLWNIATRSYLLTVGSPSHHAGSLSGVGPNGHELLTSPAGSAQGHLFYLWDIP